MYDVEVLREEEVKARKQHDCDTCGSVILPKEKYNMQTNIASGSIYTWRNCNYCKEIREEAFEYYYETWGVVSMDRDSFYSYIDEMGLNFKPRVLK